MIHWHEESWCSVVWSDYTLIIYPDDHRLHLGSSAWPYIFEERSEPINWLWVELPSALLWKSCTATIQNNYSISALTHGETQSVSKTISVTNGTQAYTQDFSCNDGQVAWSNEVAGDITCNSWYSLNNWACEEAEKTWNDAKTVLLLDGNNDTSPSGHSLSLNWDVNYVITEKQIWEWSYSFDGNLDYLNIADSTDFNFESVKNFVYLEK